MSADPQGGDGPLAPGQFPVLRVRLPCRHAAEFRARFAERIATKGLFVPSTRPRPVGARVELVLELRDGAVVRGVALAVEAAGAEGERRGTTFRFVRLVQGSLEHDDAAPAPPPAGVSPAPAAAAATEAPPEAPRAGVDDAAVVDEASADESERTVDVPLRVDVLETRAAADAAERVQRGAQRRRRAILGGAAALAAAVVGLSAYLAGDGRTRREIEEHVAAADARLADGRLTGGDAALDHLVAARTLSPDDPGVRERLHLLADKLEQLGAAAAARGDYAEAAVHLTAAAQAEPDRGSIHVRLGEIARGRGRPREAGQGSAP